MKTTYAVVAKASPLAFIAHRAEAALDAIALSTPTVLVADFELGDTVAPELITRIRTNAPEASARETVLLHNV